jgi:hypothetical protein
VKKATKTAALLLKKAEKLIIPPLPQTTRGKKTIDKGVVIRAPKFAQANMLIVGTAPYVQHAFSQKQQNVMIATQEAGQQAKKGRTREAKDFNSVYEGAIHYSRQGWIGIPASAFRNGMISACRTVGYKMTLAKLSVFVEANGFDRSSGDPLVKITKGKPRKHYATARNANGATDVRCRPMWDEGWEAIVTVRWDQDQFSASDVVNLLARVGLQVGIGEGRPDSRESAGLGWGLFKVKS